MRDAARGDELFGIRELAEVAGGAGYWGGYPAGASPLDDAALKPAMREGAARLAGAEGCRWWWSGIDRAAQACVQWAERDAPAPVLGQAAEALRNVDAEDDEREKVNKRYRRRRAGKGPHGEWWTYPFPSPISTTRRVGRLGALLLAGQEDGFGDVGAVAWPLAVADNARIFEVDSPGACQALVSAYPRPATHAGSADSTRGSRASSATVGVCNFAMASQSGKPSTHSGSASPIRNVHTG